MAPQVSRVILAFVALGAVFMGFRSIAVPKDFGTAGFHRTQGPKEIAASPLRHAGREACAACHEDKVSLSPHVKAGVGCETCHGPAKAHVDDFEHVKPFKPSERAFCARCHAAIVGRRATFPQIDPKTHNPDARCIDCHTIHPTEAPHGTPGTK